MKYLYFVVLSLFCLSSAKAQCTSPQHRAFDFWVGEWNVYKTGTDTLLGTNSIKPVLNTCVIEENWKSAKGNFAGKSFNTYNPVDSTWNQVWVDTGGNTFHFKGQAKADAMLLSGHTIIRGTYMIYTMNYYLDKEKKTVRQLWKASGDGGANWQIWFDGTYVRKK